MKEFISGYVEKHSIPFKRGTPKDFGSWLARIYTLFTLPSLLESQIIEGMKAKCLYGLWNVVIDDRIDHDHNGKEDLFDTIKVIQGFFSDENMVPETASGQIMKDFLISFRSLSKGPNSEIARETLFLDLLRTANAFDYERIALSNSDIVTLSEFMEFSTSTVDVRCTLDIDLTLIQKKINPITIGKLREVYKILAMAFRLFNDLATFQREFSFEKSLNSVILHGIDRGILPRNILSLSEEEKENYKEDISLLHKDIEDQIGHYKKLAVSKISQITEMNMDPLKKNFGFIVRIVSSECYIEESSK